MVDKQIFFHNSKEFELFERFAGKRNEHAMDSFVLSRPPPDVSRSPVCEVGGPRSADD